MAALCETDGEMDAPPGQGAFAAFVAPMKVTSQVMSQIKALPIASARSKSAIWYVHTFIDHVDTGTNYTCQVHQIVKEHG